MAVGGVGLPLVYDAFVSYSHAADGLLAPRLQTGLQRFAKPWWRRRAVRVFRDESSLSANPHLWSSIVEAMGASSWFVLMLSEEAAKSPWVNREVEWWVAHKGASRILPVVTDGEFGWDAAAVASWSTAAPPALSDVFAEEPRWVDLRWARSEAHLHPKDPRFSDAIADLSSAIRGIPKDDLNSEEVRQHRRTVRTAWAAAVTLLALATAATIGAVIAVDRSNEATAQHRVADEARGEAEAARALAETAQMVAEGERDRANGEADRANRTLAHLIDLLVQTTVSAELVPPPDAASADIPSLRPPARIAAPETPHLDFLTEYCEGTICHRDAVMARPDGRPIGAWSAYAPFHIRHGFVNTGEEPLPIDRVGAPGYDLRLFVTRRLGPEVAGGAYPIDETFRFHIDYTVRMRDLTCGTAYALGERPGPQPCEMFVHDFPGGLPPGRYDFWVEWRAPCEAWIGAGAICDDIDVSLGLVVSQVNMPFYGEGFTESDDDN